MFLKSQNQWVTATLLFACVLVPCGSLAAQQRGCAVVDVGMNAGRGNRSPREAARGIYDLLDAWRNALQTGDLQAVAGLVTDDAEFWSQATAPLVGPAALANSFRAFVTNYQLVQDFDCDELVVRGDVAFIRGTEHNRLTPKAGGQTVVVEQRAFSIMRRGTDGRWRFSRGMTNQPPQR